MAINATIHFVTGLIQEVIPYAIQSAFQAGFQDPRVGRVVSGAVFVTMGACLVANSGIRKTLPSWCWGKKPPVQNTTRKVVHYWRALFGLTAICFGVYQAAYGIFFPPDAAEMSYRVRSPSISTGPSFALSEEECQKSLEITRKAILSCPFSKGLVEEAKKRGGPFSLKCGPFSELKIDRPSSTIFLGRNTHPLLHPYDLLTEVSNLKKSPEYLTLSEKMCLFKPDEYRKWSQIIEYGSYRESVETFNKCLEKGFWPELKSQNVLGMEIKKEASTMDAYLQTLATGPHADHLRQQWHDYCDKKEL